MFACTTLSTPSLPPPPPFFSSAAELQPATSAPATLVPASAPAARPMNERLVRRSSSSMLSSSGISPLLPLVDVHPARAPLPRVASKDVPSAGRGPCVLPESRCGPSALAAQPIHQSVG